VIKAGQQLCFTQNHLPAPTAASAGREAWHRGLLLADNLPLGQLLEELSRYRPGHLGCDPAVAGLPVMGSFPLKDTDQALRLLEAALPVQVHKTLEWWVSVGPKT
jgi:transmembrane sensor